ncbi:transglycosylase domain-containing protein [Marihabitans asiaticum]|uniref:Membrane peptidoglycan carboxypeptidase n=1 Tax=Marihabitans asiaticum TaxID=415218 RepID=A0A560WDL7_9MICO|nr:transglycosylase domain-containing protein [Marihabitans asiaticum]TWD15751.1 membrane peptidoglycan carboxypeptidase [Marihabitans asiaticum]
MRRSSAPHLTSLLGAFLAVAVGMGMISAGLVMPLAGAAGTAARSTVTAFEDLDDEFTAVSLAQQSKIISADNKTLATPYDANRIIVPMKKISPWMIKAQLAIEDSRFYEHGGIDLRGTSRAFFSNLTSQETQGGSSITQQYVKIMLQEKALREDDQEAAKAAVEQTYSRKLQEMKIALNVEETHTKDQILRGYLNLVYYGDQAYGVEAAARHFFSKSAKDLDIGESATLAGVVQSPGVLNIRTNTAAVQERRDVVLDRMHAVGVIDEEQLEKFKGEQLEDMIKLKRNEGGTCTKAVDPYFCNYVISYLKTMPELGPDPDARQQAVFTGGLTIKTTLRSDWQKEMHRYLTEKVPNGDPSGVGAAAAMIEPGTGKVRAIAQTSQYKVGLEQATTKFSEQAWTYPTTYGGTNGFAIGSTAKMYALATALGKGKPVESTINAPVAGLKRPHTFTKDEFDSNCTTTEPWEVQNDFTSGGRLTLRNATANSINTAFAQLASDVGSCEIPKTMTAMGLTDGNGEKYGLARDASGKKVDGSYSIANLVLGSDSTSPVQLASSFATLAADGKYCPPSPIESITTASGKEMEIKRPECKQVIDTEVARGVTDLLTAPLKEGTASNAQLAGGREAAGKTGTTDQHRQSWFVGYTPQLATSVWVGTPITEKQMDRVNIGGRYYDQVFGGTIAAPLWKQIMDTASKEMEAKTFPEPAESTMRGDDPTSSDGSYIPPVAPSAPAEQQQTG